MTTPFLNASGDSTNGFRMDLYPLGTEPPYTNPYLPPLPTEGTAVDADKQHNEAADVHIAIQDFLLGKPDVDMDAPRSKNKNSSTPNKKPNNTPYIVAGVAVVVIIIGIVVIVKK